MVHGIGLLHSLLINFLDGTPACDNELSLQLFVDLINDVISVDLHLNAKIT